MEQELASLRELRGRMVGTERGLHTLDGLPKVLEERLTRRLSEQSKRAKVRRYLSDLGQILGEMSRILRPNGLAVVVLGPTIINTTRTDACDIVGQLAEAHGLTLVAEEKRQLADGRRSLPPPNSMGEANALHKRMRSEILVALRKDVSTAQAHD